MSASTTPAVDPRRVRMLTTKVGVPEASDGSVDTARHTIAYWMSRDQRAEDNWALLYAQQLALEHGLPLQVFFRLVPSYPHATERAYAFLLAGLREVEQTLRAHGIPFHLLLERGRGAGSAATTVLNFVRDHHVRVLVCDMSPMRVPVSWVRSTAARLDAHADTLACALAQVDAHNIVPVWVASEKHEYAARTIRPRIGRVLGEFLVDLPPLRAAHAAHAARLAACTPVDWAAADAALVIDRTVRATAVPPGTAAARRALAAYVARHLHEFEARSNDPNYDAGQSRLSPYLHFGQLSAQRVALEVKAVEGTPGMPAGAIKGFLEQLIVRRELCDNHCFYEPRYDQLEGTSPMGRRTLEEHEGDVREYTYTRDEWDRAETHDDIWNAAQNQMVLTGRMHGYMRMYWAKKILEWSASPQEALATALYLNDRYMLDGRDPNGVVGCMWAIAGLHDQGWKERPVFGKIRCMNAAGCERKFDVEAYAQRWASRAGPAERPANGPLDWKKEKARRRRASRKGGEKKKKKKKKARTY